MSLEYGMGYVEGTDVPLEHLDYDYVRKCTNGAELEKILRILRSGKEGVFPDLINTTEDCLRKIKPNSKLLIKAQNITKVTDLPNDEWKTVDSDLQQWERLISREDQNLSNGDHKSKKDIVRPSEVEATPIRKGGVVTTEKQDTTKKDKQAKPVNPDRIKSYDFKSWDKFDVNKEAEKVDKERETEKKSTDTWSAELTGKEKNMSNSERQRLGLREREKGNEAFRAGDYDEALSYYTRSISLFPGNPAAYNNRALVYIKQKRFELAASDCRETLQRDPNNTKALLRSATALKALKEYPECVEMCERLLKLDPNNKKCQKLLTTVRQDYVPDTARDSNRHKGKRITIEEVDQKIDKETVNLQSTSSNTKSDTGITVASESEGVPMKSSNPPAAVVTTPTAPSVTTPIVPPPLPTNVQFLKDSGNELFRVGQYGAAVDKYTKAIQLIGKEKADHSHSLSTLLSNRSACHLKNGDCRSCVDDASRAITLNPLNIKALIRRGMAYETMEKYRNAFSDYQLVLSVDPKVDKVQESTSRITKILRDQDGKNWREKLPANPDQDRVMGAVSSSSSITTPTITPEGKPDVPQTPPPSANPAPQRLLTDEELFEDYKLKGNKFVKQGEYDSAIPFYTACIKLCPQQTVAFTNRALCYLKTGKHEECQSDCTSALDLEPTNIKALYRRALSKKALCKYQESLKDLKLVIDLDPKNTAAKKEKDIVHDLYLKELRQIQATTQSTKEPKPSTETTQPKPSSTSRTKSPKHKSSSATAAPPTSKATSTTTSQKEKKRKKVTIEEVTEEGETKGARKDETPPTPKVNLRDIKPEKGDVGDLIQLWNSLPRSATPLRYAELLLKIPPSLLGKVISNKLEGHTLSSIIASLDQYIVPEGLLSFAYDVLAVLPTVQRFGVIKMFLSTEDTRALKSIFAVLIEDGSEFDEKKLIVLKKAYSV